MTSCGLPSDSVLLFELQNRMFCIPLDPVEEILAAVDLLPIPGCSSAMEGLLDLRGKMVPVLDLAALLDMKVRGIKYTDHLIVLNLDGERVAIRVDRTRELTSMAEAKQEKRESSIAFGGSLVSQVFRYKNDLVSLLEPRTLAELMPARNHGN